MSGQKEVSNVDLVTNIQTTDRPTDVTTNLGGTLGKYDWEVCKENPTANWAAAFII
jgi:hypothetical protein